MNRSVENDRQMLLASLSLKRQQWLKSLASEADALDKGGYHNWSGKVSNLRSSLEAAIDEAIIEIHGG